MGNKKLTDSDLILLLEKQELLLKELLDFSQRQFAENDPVGLDRLLLEKERCFEEMQKIDSLLERWYTQFQRELNQGEKTLEQTLQELLEKSNSEYKKEFLNKSIEVLFENKLKKQNKYFGRDKFLNSVIVESSQDLTGQIQNVTINDFNHNNLFGTILSNEKRNFAA